MRKLFSSIVCVALLLGACGGRSEPPELARPPGAPPPIALPTPVDAIPVFAVLLKNPPTDTQLTQVRRLPQVASVATVALGDLDVGTPSGTTRLTVGAVDPIAYRPNAPEVTRDADFVWTSLLRDDAVLTWDVADQLGLSGAVSLTLGGAGRVDVGAYAENGVPNLADVLVNQTVGRKLGLGAGRLVVVGKDPDSSDDLLQEQLEDTLADARVVNLLPQVSSFMSAAAPEVGTSATSLIPTMNFKVLDDGFIKPDKEWVKQNIATGQVPIIGEVTCHRVMIPRLFAVLAEIESKGLANLIRPDDYGGCYVPRFIDRDPTKPLSMHAFGLAADFNVSTNLLGSKGDMDPRIVAIFEKWGFTWGGEWERPDPMHFELTRLVNI